jgi:anti-sigma regulatory factor (Ser/Thr protein kinase)
MTASGTDVLAPDLAAWLATSSPPPGTPSGRPRRRVFPGHPAQVAHARRFVQRTIGPHHLAADAALLTSELATNAIQHSASGQGGTFEIVIWQRPATVRVAVIDAGAPSIPAPRSVGDPGDLRDLGDLAASGRGLALVDALARQWGQHGNRHRRAVWFELDAP